MAGVKVAELRGVSDEELRQRIGQARKELGLMRVKAGQGVVEQPHLIPALRRDIAKMMTILNEARRAGQQKQQKGKSHG